MKIKLPKDVIFLKLMRISVTQLCLAILFVGLSYAKDSFSQEMLEKRITLRVEEKSIKSILTQIENETNLKFVYSPAAIDAQRKVSINVQNQSLKETFDAFFLPLRIKYRLSGKKIVLSTQTNSTSLIENKAFNSNLSIENNFLDFIVKGTVTDEKGEGLPSVSVSVKGTPRGSTTNTNGEYSISVPDTKAILVFSYIGFESKEIEVGSKTTLNVSLKVDNKTLEEVVVVGYGTVKKSDLTGSVSSVKAEQIAAYPAGGITQVLQGRAAGVQIQSNNGDPGASFKIRIRGGSSINASSDPIFVIDGFVGGTLPPPEDIESIEVLKDASATAIYGSRGANGVVMVTTKQGKEGKTKVEFNTSYSSQNEINRLELLNAEQYTAYVKEVIPTYVSPGGNTDWQDQIFKTGAIQNHQLSFSGGNQSVKYYVSGSIFDQKGIIIGTDFNRYSLTNNLSFKVNEKIKVGVNLFAQRTGRKGTRTQEGSGGANEAGAVSSAFKFMPNQGVYNNDGTYTLALQGDPIDNPFAIITERLNESVNDRLQSNFSVDYDILKDLKFKATLGASINNQRQGTFIPTTLNQGRAVGGEATQDGNKNTNIINENYLTYTKTLAGVHNLSVLGGYSFQKTRFENWGARGQSFITNAVSVWNLGSASVYQAPNSNLSEAQLSSYFGRINYGFKDRYLLTLNARYDGSSNFSKNNKWAFFPSGAVAWNVMNEAFMKNFKLFDSWKIRGSYGLTGNQAIGPYQTLAGFSSTLAVINGKIVNAVRPTTVANDNLTWETTTQFDLGTDISFLNNRFNLTLDYYNRVTKDLLFSVPLPQYSGFQTQLKNIGKVENKGFEIGLNSKVLTGAFKWNVDINVSANKNKVLELPDNNDIQYGAGPGHMIGLGNTQILRVGQPVGSFLGWVYEGVYQTGDAFLPGAGFETVAGGEKFKDLNGDGKLDANDRQIVGNPNPKFIWGISNDFKYKNFDLNIFFQGSQGNDLLSFTLLEIESMASPYNSTIKALNRWTPSNTNTDIPKRSLSRTQRVSTRWVYDGSYARLKNLAIGYNLPSNMLKKAFISKLRIYASAQNILTFTKYPGYDPEVNYNSDGSGSAANRNLGLDYGSYPNAKSYTIGLNIGF
jgi:TonB-dependent starch-binding outer membrane protein SusC